MNAATIVRPGRGEDAASVARVQRSAWRAGYSTILPVRVLDSLSEDVLAEGWRAAAERPPSARHRLLVAVESDEVVGFSAFGPATDADRDPDHDAELHTLLVDPAAGRRGHGSRLLAATADLLREDGFGTAVSWLLAADDRLRAFLADAGWAADGARRDLDASGDGSAVLHQVRLHTDLTDAPAEAAQADPAPAGGRA